MTHNGPIELIATASDRLRWLKGWRALIDHGLSSQRAAEVLHIPRATLYRWERRMKSEGLRGLEDRSRRPRRCRRPQWSPELSEAAPDSYREQYGWDREKLAVLLRQEGWQTSASTVGRIMNRLKTRGGLREPPRNGIWTYKRRVKRPYATCKPKEYTVREPGDLVQLDTLDVRPLPNVVIKQITARDMVSRWDVIEAFRSATAGHARQFLGTWLERSPYPIKAIQVDRGSEFQAELEQACQEKGIRPFVLPPRPPNLNGHVERAQRTLTEEFHDRYMGDLELRSLNKAMQEWEYTYVQI